ncbi:GFA family protein [Piscinibacter koreensis]|uniref:GFA family protein n=1 Tax=Piscinibacter koreensis TaxID=2742824 RepID=UPI001C37A6A3
MTASFSGGCLCGACRYTAHGEPINVRVCHCRSCQKALGATFNARVLMPRAAVELGGPIGWARSSPELARGFCTLCGSTLFSERAVRGWIGITLASLDEPERFTPTEHIWTSSKPAWLQLADGLPHYPEAPPG